MKKLLFTVTNDLTYDQRMIRICNSLQAAGYEVTLVGRTSPDSSGIISQSFVQRRLNCFFTTGKAFYIEYNLKLFVYLLFKKADCICAIDLDTILPCYAISTLKNVPRVYDAHELFCEMKEIVTRPVIYSVWKRIEKFCVPRFRFGYTVNRPIADEFKKMYKVEYAVIRNFPVLKDHLIPNKKQRYILYQGAVNEGRSFETLIPAMTGVDCQLYICGNGNFMEQAKDLVKKHHLQEKVIFHGRLTPQNLQEVTNNACIGITIFENKGLSNFLSLANRFTDYVHAAVPQICVDYPVYADLNKQYRVAVLLNDLQPQILAKELNALLNDNDLYRTLQNNCLKARQVWNWQSEEKRLTKFYQNVFERRG